MPIFQNIKDDAEPPLIVVVIMIKNEAVSIEETLNSYVSGGLKHFFILDTGSTDNTIAIVEAYFKKHPVSVSMHQEPFIDFAQSRNRALELAEHCFSTAIFFMMPDAEWHLQYPAELIQFCEQERTHATPLYLLTIKMNSVEFTTARLFRVNAYIRFRGVVHEVPEQIAEVKVPDPICFQVLSTQQGIEKSKLRWERDLVLLSNALTENADDPRTVFYLAQTYECLERLEEAYHLYQIRAKLPGWDEENFITYFRLGCLAERLSQQTEQSVVTWDHAMNYFLQAFALRPHRIEPLVKMANHYWPSNAQACYLFIKHAYDLPYPKQDRLFIEKDMYDYERYEIMSRCAWYVGEYALGVEATSKALERRPNTPHLCKNLELYEEKVC
ncbi:MAG: glycosyltransferase [Gammaproteobacteria bacterium]